MNKKQLFRRNTSTGLIWNPTLQIPGDSFNPAAKESNGVEINPGRMEIKNVTMRNLLKLLMPPAFGIKQLICFHFKKIISPDRFDLVQGSP